MVTRPPTAAVSTASDPSTASATATISRGRRQAVLGAMCLALVLVVAGVSMLNLALPLLSADLGASSSEQL